MSVLLNSLRKDLRRKASRRKASILAKFFKTDSGEYAEKDKFLGITVSDIRSVIENFKSLSFCDLQKLLDSPYHEERLSALLFLVDKYSTASRSEQKRIYRFYLKNTKRINNWDLVDLTAEKIIGPYLEDKNKDILFKLAKSKNLWERRIAILSTFYYIKKGNSKLTFEIAKILLNDKHDLIHKVVGWMLREVGKRCSEKEEEKFLKKYYKQMPRTMLRYAIERFPKNKRLMYLNNKF